ncbi:gp38 [Burkholderia lata]|uniref:hypothetical protein n=1 Tax=Burkholderia lata (strain ATCC 17760 / DSM 23089 / LMG 22485 / NCIMB 9086 / R18194 / 383) TaxID=482957 RepID=UPI0014547D65|nr:hypothetical protein [Burkholderia lata]VWB76885.1 gp38 [Burkholderia lata]
MTMITDKNRADALTDEQIIQAGYMHCVDDDEPLFQFGRRELLLMVRELLAASPVEQHEAAPADRRHVGDSKFEGWYSSYAAKGETNPKQIARDSYAAGMGDDTPQPEPPVADERVAFDYDDVVSICDAHGICLPVDCIETVVEIVQMSGLLPARAPSPNAAAEEPTIPADLHHDTAKLVRRFARALANKLLSAQRKYGYSDNWMRDDWADECRAELMRHIRKGDPRDVAAYCAFLWHHNESTAPAQAEKPIGIVHRPARNGADFSVEWLASPAAGAKLYTAPTPPAPASAPVGLTDEDIERYWKQYKYDRRPKDITHKDAFARILREIAQSEPHAEVTVSVRAYPDELTDDLRHVLGFPNFRCVPYAHLMVAAGAKIDPRSEDEQAHVLHWLVKLVIDHGERWADVAEEEMNTMRAQASVASSKEAS